MRLYFAYGANINLETMRFRCPEAKMLSLASVENKKFIINQFGVASIVDSPDSTVHGVLWQISETDEESLDIFEGVDYNFYYKGSVSVKTDNAVIENVLVYLATDEKAVSPLGESNYLNQIVSWASAHGFPEKYISKIRKS